MKTKAVTLGQALQHTQTRGLDRLDAQMLMLLALQRNPNDRAWLMSHDQDVLSPEAERHLDAYVKRRLSGEPMAYIEGAKAFFGLSLRVDSRVLVPRPDTETLVEWTLECLQRCPAPAAFLDLGTGSGAIALSVKSHSPTTRVTATDASTDALDVASSNAERLGLDVTFLRGSWLNAVVGQHFHLIASNPPYIAEADVHLPALAHEPISALTAGRDGLNDLRDLVSTAPEALASQGWLLLEHGHDQASAVRALLSARGFQHVQSRTDLAGIERCSGGQWPQGR